MDRFSGDSEADGIAQNRIDHSRICLVVIFENREYYWLAIHLTPYTTRTA